MIQLAAIDKNNWYKVTASVFVPVPEPPFLWGLTPPANEWSRRSFDGLQVLDVTLAFLYGSILPDGGDDDWMMPRRSHVSKTAVSQSCYCCCLREWVHLIPGSAVTSLHSYVRYCGRDNGSNLLIRDSYCWCRLLQPWHNEWCMLMDHQKNLLEITWLLDSPLSGWCHDHFPTTSRIRTDNNHFPTIVGGTESEARWIRQDQTADDT